MLKKILFSILIILGISFLLLEIASFLTLSSLKDKPSNFKIFYADSQADFIKKSRSKMVEAHPFFGFVATSSDYYHKNNIGFLTPINFPYKKSPADFVIGIFGGSVASSMALYIEKHPHFIEILKQKAPSLGKRNIVFLNFALPVAKQPQQFAIYSHYQDMIDITVNLDGYNEVSFNSFGQPVEFPFWYSILFQNQIENFEKLAQMKKIRQRQNDLFELPVKHKYLAKSSLFYFVWKALTISLEKDFYFYSEGSQKGYSIDSKSFKNNEQDKEELNRMLEGARNWAYYTNLQATLAKALHKRAIFILQPTIRENHSKVLSKEELAFLELIPNKNKLIQTTKVFQLLKSQLAQMDSKDSKDSKVTKFLDLTYIFKNKPETIYTDDCCHLNSHGYDLLIDTVFTTISQSL